MIIGGYRHTRRSMSVAWSRNASKISDPDIRTEIGHFF